MRGIETAEKPNKTGVSKSRQAKLFSKWLHLITAGQAGNMTMTEPKAINYETKIGMEIRVRKITACGAS